MRTVPDNKARNQLCLFFSILQLRMIDIHVQAVSNLSVSFTAIFPYACESWTLTAELLRRIQAMEMRCYRKMLHISYKDHVTNEEVRAKIQQAFGPHEDLTIVKRRKLQWYGHVSRSSGLAKTILQGTVKGGKDEADRGRCGKTTSGNGQAWILPSPRGQWRPGKNGGNWLRNHLWCPNDPRG